MSAKNNSDNNLDELVDVENIDVDNKKTDFVAISGNLFSSINFKVAFFLFLLGMILFSNLFINGVLSKFSNSVSGECTTTKGTVIQLGLFSGGYILIDLLVQKNII